MDLKALGIRDCYVKISPLIMPTSYSFLKEANQTDWGRNKYERKCKMDSNNVENNVLKNMAQTVDFISEDPNITHVCSSCRMICLNDYSLTVHENECPFLLKATMPDQLSVVDFCNQVGLVQKNEKDSTLKQINIFICKKWKKMSIPFSTKRGFKLALEAGKTKSANYHRWCATHSENPVNKTRSVKEWTKSKTKKGKIPDSEYCHTYSFNKAERYVRNTEIATGIKKVNWWKLNYCCPITVSLKKLTEQEIEKSTSKRIKKNVQKKLLISLKKLTDQDIKKWTNFVELKKFTISLKRLSDQDIKKWTSFVDQKKCFGRNYDYKINGKEKMSNITIPLFLIKEVDGVKYFS